jgi:hypothetical protein
VAFQTINLSEWQDFFLSQGRWVFCNFLGGVFGQATDRPGIEIAHETAFPLDNFDRFNKDLT